MQKNEKKLLNIIKFASLRPFEIILQKPTLLEKQKNNFYF